MSQFGGRNSGFFTNSQTTVNCQFVTCCTINQCGVEVPDSGCCATVRCGANNCASGGYSATLGGRCNTSSGLYSAIVGGFCNIACGCNSFIGGGQCNTASGVCSFVGSGQCNTASGIASSIVGGLENIACVGSFVGGGCTNYATGASSVTVGGVGNRACCQYSTTVGGGSNTANGNYSFIGGGSCSTASGCYSAILGGQCNNSCTFANSFIVGSNICASRACTTFVNDLSICSLTTGSVPFVGTAGLITQDNPNLFWDDTNNRLGIGTATPLGILHLFVSAAATRMLLDGNAGQSKIITYRTNGLQRFGLYVNNTPESGSNVGSDFQIRAYNDAGTLLTIPLFIKRSSGNVGIGTTSPAAKLDILGANEVMNISGTNATSAYTGYYYNTSTLVGYIGNGSSILSGAASSDFIFRSQGALVYAAGGNNERMRITSGGNVLIGTTTDAGFKLDVNGTGRFKLASDRNLAIKYDTNITLSAQADGGGPENLRIYADTFRIYTATSAAGLTERLTIASTGAATFGNTLTIGGTTNMSGTDVTSVYTDARVQSAVTGTMIGYGVRMVALSPSSGSYTVANMYAIKTSTPVVQPNVTVTNSYGIYIGRTDDPSSGGVVTNRYALVTEADAGNVLIGSATDQGNWKAQVTGNMFIRGSGATSATNGLYMDNSSGTILFSIRNDGDINTGTAAASPYNNTTGSAANVFIGSTGAMQRSTSSLKYKTDVRDYDKGLDIVNQLRPVYYKGKTDGDTQYAGLIAEEIHDLGLTEFVQYATDGTPDALAYSNMIALAFKAIQELSAKNEALIKRIETLENK